MIRNRSTVFSLRTLRGVTAAIFLLVTPDLAAQEYTVNLKDTDIQEFIKFVADVWHHYGGGSKCEGKGAGHFV